MRELGSLRVRERPGHIRVAPHGATRQGAQEIQVLEQRLCRIQGRLWLILDLAPSLEKQQRIRDDPRAQGRRATAPGRIQTTDILRAQSVMRDRRGQRAAGLAIRARHGDQVLHGRVGADLAQAQPILNRLRELLHERQPARDPARAAVETPGQGHEVQTKRPPQLAEQPALLDRGLRFRLAQRAAEHKRLALAESPDRGQDRVATQAAQSTQPLVTVDHHKAARLARRDHHDRNLLAVLGE